MLRFPERLAAAGGGSGCGGVDAKFLQNATRLWGRFLPKKGETEEGGLEKEKGKWGWRH